MIEVFDPVDEATRSTGIRDGSMIRFHELRHEPTVDFPDGELWREQSDAVVGELYASPDGWVMAPISYVKGGESILHLSKSVRRQIQDGKITVLS